MTFSYNARCRKEGTIQNRYIQHIYSCVPGRVAQSVTCLATDASLTADPGPRV